MCHILSNNYFPLNLMKKNVNGKPFLKKIDFIILLTGLAWIALNVFFLQFFAWTTGIVRPWLMLHGYIPYRDFVWMRTPLDLFFLSRWLKIFGVSADAYQLLIYTILIILAISVFFIGYKVSAKLKYIPFLFYVIFLFPLFQNTEIGELLVGLWSLWLFFVLFCYLNKRSNKLLIISGLISGVALITKQNSGALGIGTVGIIIFDCIIQKKTIFTSIKKCFYFTVGFALPVLALILYYSYNKGLNDLVYYTVSIVLDKYNKKPLPDGFSRGDTMWIETAYLVLLIPFLFLWRYTKLSIQKVMLFPIFMVALLPSVLPSFLSYRAFTSFPIVSILVGYNIYLFKNGQIKTHRNFKKFLILFSFIVFIACTLRFVNPYISSIQSDGFHFKSFIKDYGEPEYKVAQWIKNNTKKGEKIMSFSSSIVYLLSDRFPTNKYIDPFPYLLYPYEQTTKVFMDNRPRIMIFDKSLTKDFPDLINWPYYKYLIKEYTLKASFENLNIYELQK